MKIEKVATGNGEEVGEKQTIKRTNSRKKKWQTKFHNLHEKKALKIKLLGKNDKL